MKKESKSKLSRRNFLLAVGAGGAATAAAIASKSVTPAVEEVATDNKRGKGYQETAHVRSYYNTTKI
jgi:shikimate 5-dehydrogenase